MSGFGYPPERDPDPSAAPSGSDGSSDVGSPASGAAADAAETATASGALAFRATPATWTLIGVNAAVALIAIASAATVPWASPAAALIGGGITPVHLWGGLIDVPAEYRGEFVGGVASGEYWRLVTSMFLHFGLLHLALNMFSLFVLGRDIERIFGSARFLALYLVSGLAGSVAVYCFAGTTITAGASGAVFGLFGALVPILRRMRRGLGPIIGTLVINLAITFGVPGISVAGHLGGLVTGLVLGVVLARYPRWAPPMVAACGIVLGVLLIATALRTILLTAGV